MGEIDVCRFRPHDVDQHEQNRQAHDVGDGREQEVPDAVLGQPHTLADRLPSLAQRGRIDPVGSDKRALKRFRPVVARPAVAQAPGAVVAAEFAEIALVRVRLVVQGLRCVLDLLVSAIDVDLSGTVIDSLDHRRRQDHSLRGQRRHRVDRDEARDEPFRRPVDLADRPLEVLRLVADDVGRDGLLADSLQIEGQHRASSYATTEDPAPYATTEDPAPTHSRNCEQRVTRDLDAAERTFEIRGKQADLANVAPAAGVARATVYRSPTVVGYSTGSSAALLRERLGWRGLATCRSRKASPVQYECGGGQNDGES